ncbi:MAG: inositol monophosphatase family protein [Myxococcota bacterium]
MEFPKGALEVVRKVAEAGGAEALARFRTPLEVDDKTTQAEEYDPVTEGDRAAERAMRAVIETRFPEHGILGEEYGVTREGAVWRWVLDPIDGTRGFVSGTTAWTSLVGLERDETPVLGAIHQPFTGETWLGGAKETRWRRGGTERICRVSGRTRLEEARIATTDPRPTPKGYFSSEEAQAFERVAACCPVARFGLDAYAYGLLALGEIDLVVEAGLQRYDVSALVPILRGAGAVVTSWTGGDPSGGGQVVAASSAELHASAMRLLVV